MIALIIILAYIASVFLNRFFTYLAVKNQGKNLTMTYEYWVIWFIPAVGTLFCLIELLLSMKNNNNNWFSGKNW